MKKIAYRGAVVSALIVLGLLVSVAPVAAQSKASAKSVDSLNAVIKELTKAKGQVQSAMDSLNALSSGGDANLKKNYDNFSKQVAGLNKTKETASARAEDMKSRREAYLAEWDKKSKEVTNPEIQAHMQARAEEVKKTFETMQPAAQSLREAFPPFLSDLNDIQKLLSVDLSSAGVASAAPIGQKAVANGSTIVQSLDSMLTTLTGIRDQVAPSKK
jgi:chromosome segregation ATPase